MLFGKRVQGAYQQYHPTVTQLNPVTSYTTDSCWWTQVGKQVHFYGALIVNNAGTATGANLVSVTYPVAARVPAAVVPLGSALIFDSSANIVYPALVAHINSTTFQLLPSDVQTTGAANALGAVGFVAALATSDQVYFSGHYEAL